MQKRIIMVSFLAATAIAVSALNPAVADEAMHNQTREDLKTAMQSEALSVFKYTAFAQHARNEGKIALAEILEQTAKAEERHFMEEARIYGLVREDWHNLSDAIVSEYVESRKTYAEMAERAEAVGDKEAAERFREIAAQEAQHHQVFKAAVARSFKSDQ